MTELTTELQRPFAANSVRWKVQAQWPKDSPRNGLVVPYVDARTVSARLNRVAGMKWSTRFERDPSEAGVAVCYLTVDGVTRADLGKGAGIEKEKAAFSDSLKRAAVHFGIGSFLYSMQAVTLKATDAGELDGTTPTLRIKTAGNKKSLVLTPAVEKWLREKYIAWTGSDRNRWGDVLDHGDEPEALGDPVEREQIEQDDLELAAKREEAKAAHAKAWDANEDGFRKAMPKGRFIAELDAASDVGAVEKLMERVAKAAA